MFIDWLKCYQDFDFDLPYIGETSEAIFDTLTGEILHEKQPTQRITGSYSTSIAVRISGRRITVDGNPSRYGRIDNLFGYTSIDDCISVFNNLLASLGLPLFTRCRHIYRSQTPDGKRTVTSSDGCTLQRIDITTNFSVGEGNELAFIKSLATQRIKNSIPNLHTNGFTVDWLSKKGNASGTYQSFYGKYNEIELHQKSKIINATHDDKPARDYFYKVLEFVKTQGIVRAEQKLKSSFLRTNNLRFWGLSDFSQLQLIHDDFLSVTNRITVNDMKFETISDQLLRQNVVKSRQAANATAGYLFMFLHGHKFDLQKRQVQEHRARLRQLGIDIANTSDMTKFSPARLVECNEIHHKQVSAPDWYRKPQPQHLRLVA